MVSVGAFIISYRRPEGLRSSIEYLLAQTRPLDSIWVVDNAADPATKDAVEAYVDRGIRYHANDDNIGPAGALATGFELLAQDGCEWFHAVDDDDAPTGPDADRVVDDLIGVIERNDDDRLGIVGFVGSRFDWRLGELTRIADDELRGDLEVDVIGGNSGITVRAAMVADIGMPVADLFFGLDDFVYCLRARRNSYRVVVNGEALHAARAKADRLGLTAERRTLVATDPFHALWRRYYVTRNYIHTMRTCFDEPRLARRMALKSVVQSVLSFGRGPRYGGRYSAMQLRGVVDGYRGRMGRTIPPVTKPTAA